MKGSVGGPLAALAAVAMTIAAFVPFWDGNKPYELAIRGLWQGYAGLSTSTFFASIALILVGGGIIMFASMAAGSQALSFLGCAWVTALLVVFTEQARGSISTQDFLLHEVDWGFWVAAVGCVLALIAGFISRSVKSDFRR